MTSSNGHVASSVTASPDGLDRFDRFSIATALITLGISWPILQLVGSAPPFFIARHSPPTDVVLFGLVVGVGVPVVAGAAASLPGLAGRLLWLLATFFGLVGLAASVSEVFSGSSAAWIGTAAVFSIGGTVTLERSRTARSICRMLVVAPLIVTGVFLLATPVGDLAFDRSGAPTAERPIAGGEARGPFILVVFDEFATASIVTTDGSLREDRYPGLARLASLGGWFPNSASVAEFTEQAVPAILSGREPSPTADPVLEDFPSNLFTLTPRSLDIHAHETVTQLCPPDECNQITDPAPSFQRWMLLGADSMAAAAHLVLPPFVTEDLPDLTTNWTNFGLLAVNGAAASPQVIADQFLDHVSSEATEASLFAIHILLPHRPWIHLADGTRYDDELSSSGRAVDLAPEQRDLALQRYLLQTQYADRLVTELIERLDQHDLLDTATIVVTADHGVAFDATDGSRTPATDTIAEVGLVPLFIKSPSIAPGTVDTYPARGVDVTPTLLDAMAVALPAGLDGVSLLTDARPVRRAVTMAGRNGSYEWSPSIESTTGHAARLDSLFPSGSLFQLVGAGAPSGVDSAFSGTRASSDWEVSLAEGDAGRSGALVVAEGPASDIGRWMVLAAGDYVVSVGRSFENNGRAVFEAMVDPALAPQGADLSIRLWPQD